MDKDLDGEIDGINVVPLVDVMLVLLTIVLTTATFIATGRIPVDLAQAKHAAAAQPTPLVLTLTLHRAIYLGDRPVTDLPAALAGLPRDTPVVVRADGGLALRHFVELVDRVKDLGFTRVSLEVRRA
ncbi:MAG: biopolymer transporter ExbD [Pseudomonadota bacterium]